MLDDDFDKWMDFHKSLFPDINQWFGRHANRKDIIGQWKYQFVGFSKSECELASNALYDCEKRPFYGDHPLWIKRFVGNTRSESSNQLPSAAYRESRCQDCHDTGIVAVYIVGRVLVEFIDRVGVDRSMTKSTCIPCDCAVGKKRNYNGLDRDRMLFALAPSWSVLSRLHPSIADERKLQVESAIEFLDSNLDDNGHFVGFTQASEF